MLAEEASSCEEQRSTEPEARKEMPFVSSYPLLQSLSQWCGLNNRDLAPANRRGRESSGVAISSNSSPGIASRLVRFSTIKTSLAKNARWASNGGRSTDGVSTPTNCTPQSTSILAAAAGDHRMLGKVVLLRPSDDARGVEHDPAGRAQVRSHRAAKCSGIDPAGRLIPGQANQSVGPMRRSSGT